MKRRSGPVAVLLLMVAHGVGAFNEPDGFRSVPWSRQKNRCEPLFSIERACADYPATKRHLGERFCPALLLIGTSRSGRPTASAPIA
jgi:hypothetical protein